MDSLKDTVDAVVDWDSFLEFVTALIADREDEVEKEKKTPSSAYGSGSNGWKNGSIESFLEAAVAWTNANAQRQPRSVVTRSHVRTRSTSTSVMLDCQGHEELQNTIRNAIQQDGDSLITEFHVWSIAPGICSAKIALVPHRPATPNEYKDRIPESVVVDHVAVEVQNCEPQSTNAVTS